MLPDVQTNFCYEEGAIFEKRIHNTGTQIFELGEENGKITCRFGLCRTYGSHENSITNSCDFQF